MLFSARLSLGSVWLTKSPDFYSPHSATKRPRVAALSHTGQSDHDPGGAAGTGEGLGRGPVFGNLGNISGEDRGKGYLLDPWLLGGRGIKVVWGLPCTEIQMPVQHPYLSVDPVSLPVSSTHISLQPQPSC